jgi:glycosyltransferase involved in cell wall biosynthesis
MRSNLKILHLVPYYEPAFRYGGPVRSVSTLCKALVQQGADVTVFTTNANGDAALPVPIASPVNMDGVRVYYFQRTYPKGFFRSTGLYKAACEHIREFDVVHSLSLWTYMMHAATRACAIGGVPRIDSPRGGLMPWDFHHRHWKKRLYLGLGGRGQLNAAAGIHCTDAIEADAIKKLHLKPPTYVVPNALELGAFATPTPRGYLRTKLGLTDATRITLFLGRLAPKKGLDLSLQAFSRIVRQYKDAVYVIAGPSEGDTERKAQALVAELGLGNRVRFIGEVRGNERLATLADADLFILTSRSENFGMAPAEAMAAGLPVLISDQTGICLSAQSAGAAKVTSLAVQDIAENWAQMLADPERLRAMGQRGKNFVQREYNPSAVAQHMITVYEDVIDNWHANRSPGKRPE